ncbi:MAG TPA: nicotinate-nucleotide adenylyltransferase [Vicinamibacterales bacterium]|nr:nicotinate-nucleotide adenylyltransferase [Vicinamibacterales bacterium]HPW19850.1 nicotinate-nucleotide adenylyltransferase [Vicinamibacterales bacterium]
MPSRTRRLGVLGGTFDPIHLGHLAAATAAASALGLEEVLLVPSRTPPHRRVDPSASVFHRFAMVALAAATDPRLVASDLELDRTGASYTADTLRALHATGLAAWQIFFTTGADAFAEIATWREYPSVLELAHFVVCARAGIEASSLRARLPELAGRMVLLAPNVWDAGRSAVGRPRQEGDEPWNGRETRIFLLDGQTPDISSTAVRARARAGRPLAGLVPPEVDDYIRRHGLYGAPAGAADGGRPAAGNLHE